MNFSTQPILENENIRIAPLRESDFKRLYMVASDPKIWEQHPNKDRYKKEVFKTFFEGALQSKGAFLITDKNSGEIAGCSRYYDYDEESNSIFIGYTFYAVKYWGKNFNPQVKKMMLDYIFQYVDLVKFHVGAENYRSQIAMERLGALKKDEIEVAYYGEKIRKNFLYEIKKSDWVS